MAQNDALNRLNAMMNNNKTLRMNVPRGSDDFGSGFATGYNMMGTIMDDIRARNDRNRLQKILTGKYLDETEGQQQQVQPQREQQLFSIGETDTPMQQPQGERLFSVGDVPKDNSFGSVLGDRGATPVVNQTQQPDYSMKNFMKEALASGMLPSNAMAAYSDYLAPLEADARNRRIRDAMRTLTYVNNGLSKEDQLKALAQINYDMGKEYNIEHLKNLTDLYSKQLSGLLEPAGLYHDPETLKAVGITINPNVWDQLKPTIDINSTNYDTGLNNNSMGSNVNTGFSQTDKNWSNTPYAGGTIGTSGCAPTTMANFLQRFGVNVTPADVAKFSSENGFAKGSGGTSWGMFSAVGEKAGVPVQQTGSWEDIINTLKAGQPVMAGHDPGKFTQNANSGSGHWLMYNGLTPDGKIIVVDPNNGKKSGTYSIDEVRSDWERNNPVAFIAKNNKALPVQQQQQQQQPSVPQQTSSFGSAFTPQVVSGRGAILNPMVLRKALVEQAERQRQQNNADREYYQKVFENNRNYNLNVERLKQQRELAEAKNGTKNNNNKSISTQDYVSIMKDYSNTPEVDENGKSAISTDLINKVGQAWAPKLQKYIQDKDGNIENAVKQMYYDIHKDKDKGYSLSHKKLVAGINSALASLSDPSNNENILKQQNAISNILNEYAKELGTITEENNGYFPKNITYWDDMVKEDENGNIVKDSNGNPILVEPLGSRNDFNTERDIEVGIIEDKIKKRDQYIREHGGYVSVPTHLGNKTENENARTKNEQLRKEANESVGLTEEQERFYYNNRASTNQRQNEEINYYENKKNENQFD